MESQIKGYRELNEAEIAAMNEVKIKGAELGELVARLKSNADLDQRWISIGATSLQQGLMALTRAIAKPTFFVLAMLLLAAAGCTQYVRAPGAEEHYLVPAQLQKVNAFGQDVSYSGIMDCTKIEKHWWKPNEFPAEHCVWVGDSHPNGVQTPKQVAFDYHANESAGPKLLSAAFIGAGLGTSGLGIRPAQVSIRGIANATQNTQAFAGNSLEINNIGKLPGHGNW